MYSKRGTDSLGEGSVTHCKKEEEEGYRGKIQKARGKDTETENEESIKSACRQIPISKMN